jgi:tRNA(Ile)-lysidine synthase
MFNLVTLFHNIEQFTDKAKFLIAYSGGMDSHVLLHCMNEIRFKNPQIKIRAVHIHHGLSVNADSWAAHCAAICAQLNIEFLVKHVNMSKHIGLKGCKNRPSLEAMARDMRYQEFAKLITADEILLTAHHTDDQAETLLLQLFRGCGPKGLAAMPKFKGLASGALLRPLLEFRRTDLWDYAKQNSLHWIEDESNKNIGYDRNFIRHKLMPIIIERWPSILNTLTRSTNHCAEASDLLDVLAQQDYLMAQGSKSNTLSIRQLLALSLARQNNLIRHWLQRQGFSMPSSIKLQHIITDILSSRVDAQPVVHWQGVEIRRYRDDLYAMKPLSATQQIPESLCFDQKDKDIMVRFRAKGDRIKIKGRVGTHSLKKLFQEKGIPPWRREFARLVFQNEELIDILDVIK